jgi:long-chain acyl-CoA synthetase
VRKLSDHSIQTNGVNGFYIPQISIYENFLLIAEEIPDDVVIEEGNEKYTATNIIEFSNRLAKYFISLDIKSNDTISILLPNSVWFLVSILASFQAGAKVTLINPRLSLREIQFQLIDSKTKILITNPDFIELIREIPKDFHLTAKILIRTSTKREGTFSSEPGYVSLEGILKKEEKFEGDKSKPDDTAFLLFSGGTSGLPKGVMLSHSNVIANAYQFNIWTEEIPEEDKGSVLSALPLCHSFGLQCGLFAPLFRKEKIIILPKFDSTAVLRIIEEKKATSFYGVPTMYVALLKQEIEKFNLSSLKLCVSGGASLPEKIHQEFQKRTGISIVEGFGMTECSPVCTINPYTSPKVNSIGKALPYTSIKVIDLETLQEVPDGEIGEIVIKGPQVMKGYLGKGLESLNVFTPDGWLKTGDLGKVDSEGYYFLVDRSKDVINSGGLKVYPREVEEILYKHPGVSLVAVVPIPDDYFGEVGKAYIVTKEGKEIVEEELVEICKESLAKYKIPKSFEFIDSLPLSAAGKILKRELVGDKKNE